MVMIMVMIIIMIIVIVIIRYAYFGEMLWGRYFVSVSVFVMVWHYSVVLLVKLLFG